MRIALLTEGTHSYPQRADGGWSGRLATGLPEHDFQRYVLLPGTPATPSTYAAAPGPCVRSLQLWGRRPGGRGPGTVRRRGYVRAYEELVRGLVLPRERASFASGLYRLAELTREDGALPGFLASEHAHRVLERVWRLPGADTAAGQPLVRDVLVAGDLLEQVLRPLSAAWYSPEELGGADLCHVVGGGPAALPALLAKREFGVPFVLTEHGLHLREQYLGYRQAPYRWPVRALLLSFFRLLTQETYRQAAVLTPGSSFDQEWQRRCGAPTERIRVVYEGTPAVARPAAGAEPERPVLVWAGSLDPSGDPELMLHAFARIRAEVPAARLLMYGGEGLPGYREHCGAVARRLGLSTAGEEPAVTFAGRPGSLAQAWESGTLLVFSARSQRGPRLLADAMLSGRALVSTDVGVAREVVGPTGLLVEPGRPPALAAACLALLADEERRARLGLAGRLRAQERFAVEPVVAAFREIYLEVVSQWPAFPAADRRAGAVPRPFARPAEFWVAGTRAASGGEGGEAGGAGGSGEAGEESEAPVEAMAEAG